MKESRYERVSNVIANARAEKMVTLGRHNFLDDETEFEKAPSSSAGLSNKEASSCRDIKILPAEKPMSPKPMPAMYIDTAYRALENRLNLDVDDLSSTPKEGLSSGLASLKHSPRRDIPGISSNNMSFNLKSKSSKPSNVSPLRHKATLIEPQSILLNGKEHDVKISPGAEQSPKVKSQPNDTSTDTNVEGIRCGAEESMVDNNLMQPLRKNQEENMRSDLMLEESSLSDLEGEEKEARRRQEELDLNVKLDHDKRMEDLLQAQREIESAALKQAAAEQKLALEREQLMAMMEEVKRENAKLQTQVALSAAQHKETLESQKLEYESSISQIKDDKLALELLMAQNQHMTGEKSRTLEASAEALARQLETIERDRAQLSESLLALEINSMEKTERFRLEQEVRAQEEEKAAREIEEAAKKLIVDYAEVENAKADVAREREELARVARENEDKVRLAHESVQGIISREREELMALVTKMKVDFLQEQKRLHETQLQSYSSEKSLGSRLSTKTSLFNLIEDSAKEESQTGIGTIIERGESKEQSADANDETQKESAPSSAQFSHLAAPHALAASGNLLLIQEMERLEVA